MFCAYTIRSNTIIAEIIYDIFYVCDMKLPKYKTGLVFN